MKTVTFLIFLASGLGFTHCRTRLSKPIRMNSDNNIFKSIKPNKQNQRAKLEFVSSSTGDGEGYRRVYDASANLLIPCSHFKTDGQIVKIHETSICQQPSQLMSFPYKWIAYVNRRHLRGCHSTSTLIQRLFKSGAQAVILSSSLVILDEGTKGFVKSGPIVLVDGSVANGIDQVLKTRQKTFVRIKSQRRERTLQAKEEAGNVEAEEKNEYLDMGIFMSFFIIVSLVCLAMLVKIKWKQTYLRNTRTKIAVEALQTMQIRQCDVTGDCHDVTSNNCAVCLEMLENGKDIRILPCHHEFHVTCIDKWLISNYTCPLCMHSIIGTHKSKSKHSSRNPFCGSLHFDKFQNILSTTRNQQQLEQHQASRNGPEDVENTEHVEGNSSNIRTQKFQTAQTTTTTDTTTQIHSGHKVCLPGLKTTKEQTFPLINCNKADHICTAQNQHRNHMHYRCPFHKQRHKDDVVTRQKNEDTKNENLNILQPADFEHLSKSCQDIDTDGQQNRRVLHNQRRYSSPIETIVFIENESPSLASNL